MLKTELTTSDLRNTFSTPTIMPNKKWDRDELLIVLNIYHKLRFGQFDQRQPVIIDLARQMGRTASSVAMKLSNLASLDPALQLRGIK
jgi:hypothetical protein